MNLIFMGTPEFAAFSLKSLINSRHHLLCVVTQPDRPKGRGMKIVSSPVKDLALENNIRCLQPEKPKETEFVKNLRDMKPDAIVVSAYGHIISKDILEIPPHGCVNIHASLLPKYRGAAPMNWAIINGETETGITIMLMDEKMDTGDILLQRKVPLPFTHTAKELHDALGPLGAELLIEALEGLEKGTIKAVKQNDSEATYAPKLKKEDGLIDWKWPSLEIYNLIRGVNPWPGAYTYMEDKLFKIWSAKIEKKKYSDRPGVISEVSKESMTVSAGEGSLSLLEVQIEDRKRMSIKDFLHGHPVEKGAVLGIKGD